MIIGLASRRRLLRISTATFAALAAAFATAADRSVNAALVYPAGSQDFIIPNRDLTTFEKIGELAHYPLILGANRFSHGDLNGNTWRAIHDYNPATRILLYQLGPLSREEPGEYPTEYLNSISRWNIARGHAGGTLSSSPSYVLYDSSTGSAQRIRGESHTPPSYWARFGSVGYQDYWASATINDILHKTDAWTDPLDPADAGTDRPWAADGLFIDVASALRTTDTMVNDTYTTTASWQAAMKAFTVAASTRIRAYAPDQLMYFNVSFTKQAEGAAYWAGLDQLPIESRPDGVLEEDAFATYYGGELQFYPASEWKRQVDTLAATQNMNVIVESRTKIEPGYAGTDNYGKSATHWDVLWFSLSSYLLGKNEVANNSYFTFWRDLDYSWLDEYDLDIGKAVGGYTTQTVISTGTPSIIPIFIREFEKAWVLVNPYNMDSASFTLPEPGKPVEHDSFQNPSDVANTDSLMLPGNRGMVVLKDPLLGEWRFDEVEGAAVADAHEYLQGHSLDATAYGSPTWLPGAGVVDGAIQFDGADDYIKMAHDTDRLVTPKELSISLWVKPDGASSGLKATVLQFGTWRQSGWQLLGGTGWNEFRLHVFGGSSLEQWFFKPYQNPLPTGQWSHLAVTLENKAGGAVKMYLNGAPFHAGTLAAPFISSASDVLYLGTNATNIASAKYWGGRIDNVKIQRKVLNPAEVAAEYRSQVADWPLDEPVYRRKVFDSYGVAHGSVQGQPAWLGSGGSGVPRGAMELDGIDDNILIDRNILQLTAAQRQFTVNAWVQPSVEGASSLLMEYGAWFYSGWVLYAGKEDNDIGILLFDGSGGYQYIKAAPPTPLALSLTAWSKLTVSVDNRTGGAVRIYVNGSSLPLATESSTNPTPTPCSPCVLEAPIAAEAGDTLVIGSHSNGSGYWQGRLGHVQLFGRILSAAEIGQLTD